MVFFVPGLVFCIGSHQAAAQAPQPLTRKQIRKTIIDEVDFKQMEIRPALRKIFAYVRVPYTVAPDVQGTVTVLLRKVGFEVVLQNVTRQTSATFTWDGKGYHIVPKPEMPPPKISPPGPTGAP